MELVSVDNDGRIIVPVIVWNFDYKKETVSSGGIKATIWIGFNA
ncbi:hypothetical protein [Rhizobium metallidurans]|uniref:Uncharacterized protein n=1 Tax=Rhizobium metallidurans TaxID=1265931 RepID=A0A7W6CTK8_9HYPH|nr:hypothetical protein [Rhizobium metallidurans]MBB3964189.1 hypothetical protein [Rhizobium metallidurans]